MFGIGIFTGANPIEAAERALCPRCAEPSGQRNARHDRGCRYKEPSEGRDPDDTTESVAASQGPSADGHCRNCCRCRCHESHLESRGANPGPETGTKTHDTDATPPANPRAVNADDNVSGSEESITDMVLSRMGSFDSLNDFIFPTSPGSDAFPTTSLTTSDRDALREEVLDTVNDFIFPSPPGCDASPAAPATSLTRPDRDALVEEALARLMGRVNDEISRAVESRVQKILTQMEYGVSERGPLPAGLHHEQSPRPRAPVEHTREAQDEDRIRMAVPDGRGLAVREAHSPDSQDERDVDGDAVD